MIKIMVLKINMNLRRAVNRKGTKEKVTVITQEDSRVECEVVELPFYDKDKLIPRGKDTTIP